MQIFAPDGVQFFIEKAQSGKGQLYALMGHLAFHFRALIATAEPGNCPREPFSFPLKEKQSRAVESGGPAAALAPLKTSHTQKVPFFLVSKKCYF